MLGWKFEWTLINAKSKTRRNVSINQKQRNRRAKQKG